MHTPRSSVPRIARFFIYYCLLAAAVCIFATCLALCSLGPMPWYRFNWYHPHFWDIRFGGYHHGFASVDYARISISLGSHSVRVPLPTDTTLSTLSLIVFLLLSVLAIGGLAWRIVRLCSNKA